MIYLRFLTNKTDPKDITILNRSLAHKVFLLSERWEAGQFFPAILNEESGTYKFFYNSIFYEFRDNNGFVIYDTKALLYKDIMEDRFVVMEDIEKCIEMRFQHQGKFTSWLPICQQGYSPKTKEFLESKYSLENATELVRSYAEFAYQYATSLKKPITITYKDLPPLTSKKNYG